VAVLELLLPEELVFVRRQHSWLVYHHHSGGTIGRMCRFLLSAIQPVYQISEDCSS
jgi:hypothetical protein